MSTIVTDTRPRGLALLLGRRRLLVVLCLSVAQTLIHSLHWESSLPMLFVRMLALGFAGLLVFGLFEQWPKRLPGWLARWALQVIAVGIAMPLTMLAIYVLSTPDGAPPFWQEGARLTGFAMTTATALLIAPWAALVALVKQKDAIARHQALAFDLERSELERQALDARLHLLQAQVAPHFLFNTLANVQALVDTGSPQASAVLGHLIAYLRAAVPRLHETATTIDQELQLVQAYLELMHMRMPDRLKFELHVDDTARALRCPPMTLLTLVENAVSHGIDPSEEGGRIDIHVRRHDDRCTVCVTDTGIGLHSGNHGLGTGLSTLRERLTLSFGGDAHLHIKPRSPHGITAEVDFPAREDMP